MTRVGRDILEEKVTGNIGIRCDATLGYILLLSVNNCIQIKMAPNLPVPSKTINYKILIKFTTFGHYFQPRD